MYRLMKSCWASHRSGSKDDVNFLGQRICNSMYITIENVDNHIFLRIY